jgi:hypothetical protein
MGSLVYFQTTSYTFHEGENSFQVLQALLCPILD